LEAFIRLTNAATERGVKIVTQRDGIINGDGSPMSEFQAGLGALVGRLALTTAKAQAKAAYEARVARGDWIGRPQYGWRLEKDAAGTVGRVPDLDRPLKPIIDAYIRAERRARTAVRILNDDLKIPAPAGGQWDRSSLLRIVTRERPDLLPMTTANGRREAAADAPARLSKLLRCPCGRFLSPHRRLERRPGRGVGRVSLGYTCAAGIASRANHPRIYVSEGRLMPWILAEWARYREPEDNPAAPRRDVDAERAILAEQRTAVIQMRQDLLINREEAKQRIAAINEQDAALNPPPPILPWTLVERHGRLVRRVVIEDPMTLAPARFNEILRSLWKAVELSPEYLPVRAIWRDPARRWAG